MDRKRKISGHTSPIPQKFYSTDYQIQQDHENDLLTLSLSSFHRPTTTTIQPPPPHFPFINTPLIAVPPPESAPPQDYPAAAPSLRRVRGRGNPTSTRGRRSSTNTKLIKKSATITPPFPWSQNIRATVRSLDYLRSKQIISISGDVQCRRCDRQYKMEFDLEQKFREIATYVAENKDEMHHRAPRIWLSPPLPNCQFCNQESSVRPVIPVEYDSINWLFLLLGQMLGCCTLEQLKYFCEHTKIHRTGAKDRVLYYAYLALCKQLDPAGPFDI